MTFWLGAFALVALALLFALWPMLARRGTSGIEVDRAALMRALYRDRMAELDAEAAAGRLDPEIRDQVVAELGANLLDEAAGSGADGAPPAMPRATRRDRPSPAAVWVLVVLLPLAGLGIYLTAGEPAARELAGATAVLRLDPATERAELEAWERRLTRRVSGHPDDGQSWYLLGVARLQLGRFAAAADAFAAAHREIGAEPNVVLYWLQSRYLASGGELDEGSRSLARQVLEARPDHPLVLEMLAIDAYRRGEFAETVELLNRALASPLSPAQRQALMGGLEQARQQIDSAGPAVDVEVPAPPGAPQDGTIFVIARPPGGGMPYAVVRRPASSLPLSVRLDDTVSMSGQKLSDAGEVEVVVRLSRSGRAAPGPGDWEWRSSVIAPAEAGQPLSLVAELGPRTGGS